jgi:hypothetical protein
MLWYFKKMYEDDKIIRYSYSPETKLFDGIVEYNKATSEFELIRSSENDYGKKHIDRMLHHLWRIIVKENAPDYRMVATG